MKGAAKQLVFQLVKGGSLGGEILLPHKALPVFGQQGLSLRQHLPVPAAVQSQRRQQLVHHLIAGGGLSLLDLTQVGRGADTPAKSLLGKILPQPLLPDQRPQLPVFHGNSSFKR